MAFHGKVAFVTGGASGMGRLSCVRLAKQGAKVYAVDMDQEGLASLSDEYDNITTQMCDVSNYEEVKVAIDRASKDLGDIDRLTHCAAIMPIATIDDMPVETFVKQMRINYEGTVFLVKSVLPGMKERNRGDIICFGSIAGELPLPSAGGYCATKAAVNAFVRQLILENKTNDLRILLICPPPVNTPLLKEEQTGQKGFNDRQMEAMLKRGVVVQPEFILDNIENGLEKNKEIVFPGYFAKTIVNSYKLAPGTVSKMVGKI